MRVFLKNIRVKKCSFLFPCQWVIERTRRMDALCRFLHINEIKRTILPFCSNVTNIFKTSQFVCHVKCFIQILLLYLLQQQAAAAVLAWILCWVWHILRWVCKTLRSRLSGVNLKCIAVNLCPQDRHSIRLIITSLGKHHVCKVRSWSGLLFKQHEVICKVSDLMMAANVSRSRS